MTYEPKVGDEVVIRGRVVFPPPSYGLAYISIAGGDALEIPTRAVELFADVTESELRGQVTGPWAVALSEALDKVEKRIDALEASAKVRDVPATMVNLAHRVQSLEVTNKTLMDTMREREDATRAELDGVLLRVGRLESDLGMIPQQEDVANLQHRLLTVEAVLTEHLGDSPAPKRPDARGQCAQWDKEDELRDHRGRVLKSKTRDTDPQGDWSTAQAADNVALSIDRQAIETARRNNDELREQLGAAQKATLQIRAANHRLMADIQRAEARLDRISTNVRETGIVRRYRLEEILQDPAHGDPPLSDPPADGDRPRPLGDAK